MDGPAGERRAGRRRLGGRLLRRLHAGRRQRRATDRAVLRLLARLHGQGRSLDDEGAARHLLPAGGVRRVLEGAANPAGAEAVVDWLLSDEVQAALPTSMYVFPVSDDVDVRPTGRGTPSSPPTPTRSRPRTSPPTGSGGSPSGRTSSAGEAARRPGSAGPRTGAGAGRLLRPPGVRDGLARLPGRRAAGRRRRAGRAGPAAGAAGRVVHRLVLVGGHAGRRAGGDAGGLRAAPAGAARATAGASGPAGAVRAAHGGGRRGLPRAARRVRPARGPRPRRHAGRDRRGAGVLQRGRRDPGGGRRLGVPGPATGRGGGRAGRHALAGPAHRHPAGPAARGRQCGERGLPLLRHRLRRRADPGRRAPRDRRDRDLPAHHDPLRPPRGGGPVAGAARRGRGPARGRRPAAGHPGPVDRPDRAPPAAAPAARRARAPRDRPAPRRGRAAGPDPRRRVAARRTGRGAWTTTAGSPPRARTRRCWCR